MLSGQAVNASLLLLVSAVIVNADDRNPAAPPERLVLAHYMPWYQAKPERETWDWHWTMNAFDPERVVDGQRAIASHFYPLIGPYDSGDPHVLMTVGGASRMTKERPFERLWSRR